MRQINQYSTPRERVTDEFRTRIDTQFTPSFSDSFSDKAINAFDCDLNARPQAMIYAPQSTFSNIFDDCEGLERGTIFADLYFPFEATCRSINNNGGMMR